MSTRPDQQEPARGYRDAATSEMGAIAEQLVTLVDEFEAALSEGHVPPAFTERLAQLRQTAEGLFGQ